MASKVQTHGSSGEREADTSEFPASTGPKRYYESKIDPMILLTDERTDSHVRVEYSSEFTAGVNRILKEGQALLPYVATWLLEQYETHGIDFRFPGPSLPDGERETRRIPLALNNPSNVDIDSLGRISVVTLRGDEPIEPVLSIAWKPLVTIKDGLESRRAEFLRNPNDLPEGRWTLDGQPAELVHLYRPYHAPIPLYSGETGPDAQTHPTLEDVSSLSPAQRAVLARYGQALSIIRGMNGISDSGTNYSIYKRDYRRQMQALIEQARAETSESEIPVAAARGKFHERWQASSDQRLGRIVDGITAGTEPKLLTDSLNREGAIAVIGRLQGEMSRMQAEAEKTKTDDAAAQGSVWQVPIS